MKKTYLVIVVAFAVVLASRVVMFLVSALVVELLKITLTYLHCQLFIAILREKLI